MKVTCFSLGNKSRSIFPRVYCLPIDIHRFIFETLYILIDFFAGLFLFAEKRDMNGSIFLCFYLC